MTSFGYYRCSSDWIIIFVSLFSTYIASVETNNPVHFFLGHFPRYLYIDFLLRYRHQIRIQILSTFCFYWKGFLNKKQYLEGWAMGLLLMACSALWWLSAKRGIRDLLSSASSLLSSVIILWHHIKNFGISGGHCVAG